VVERALAAFGKQQTEFTCLDMSAAAIANIRDRFPTVNGIISDARSMPLDAGSFDIVTSQFGVEYAGLEAIDEATRLVATGGRLGLLLHSEAGSIQLECKASLEAIDRLKACRFIPSAIELFRAGFAAVKGADRTAYEAAAKRLAPAVKALEEIMQEYGQDVAGDTIARLYSDVGQIHQEMQHYEPGEVLDWLGRMDQELNAYAGRMSSMTDSAIDSQTFKHICDGLSDHGFNLERAAPLRVPEHDLPLAWVLVATSEAK